MIGSRPLAFGYCRAEGRWAASDRRCRVGSRGVETTVNDSDFDS